MEIVKEHDVTSPLFLYLAYQAVHAPREAPDSYVDAYNGVIQDQDRKVFAGMLTCMDEGIGNLTAALDARGMLSNTLVPAPYTIPQAPPYIFTPARLAYHLIKQVPRDTHTGFHLLPQRMNN